MSLVVWLPLNGNLDNQGLSDVTVTNNGATVDASGKIGSCYSFNGSSYIDTGYIENFGTNDFSIAVWIYITQTSGKTYQCIVGNKGTPAASVGISIYWNQNQKKFLWSTADGSSSTEIWTAETFDDIIYNTWNHIIMVRNNSDSKKGYFYINGVRKELASVPAIRNVSNTSITLKLGSVSPTYAAYYYTGKINDLRIYNHALSQKEAIELSKALILHYMLDELSTNNILPLGYQQLEYIESSGTSYFNTNFKFNAEVDSFNIAFKGNDTTNNGMIFASSSKPYFWLYYYSGNGIRIYADNGNGQQGIAGIASDLNKHIVEFKNKHYYVDNVDKGTLSNTYTSTVNNMWLFSYGSSGYSFKGRVYYLNINSNNGNRSFIPAQRLSDNAIGMYEFITDTFYTSSNESFIAGPAINSTIFITDVSGYHNDGSALGKLLISTDTPRFEHSTEFNGTTSGVLIENLNIGYIINNSITYTFWIKPNSENGARSVYFGSYSGTSFSIEKRTDNKLRLYWNGSPDIATTLSITDGTWQHIAIAKNNTTEIKVYLNGSLIQTINNTFSNKEFPTTFRLGRDSRSNDGTPYKGLISDFRIYATTLSEEDVQELYNTSASIDNKGNLFTYSLNETN